MGNNNQTLCLFMLPYFFTFFNPSSAHEDAGSHLSSEEIRAIAKQADAMNKHMTKQNLRIDALYEKIKLLGIRVLTLPSGKRKLILTDTLNTSGQDAPDTGNYTMVDVNIVMP